jgi:hypothetical protein
MKRSLVLLSNGTEEWMEILTKLPTEREPLVLLLMVLLLLLLLLLVVVLLLLCSCSVTAAPVEKGCGDIFLPLGCHNSPATAHLNGSGMHETKCYQP